MEVSLRCIIDSDPSLKFFYDRPIDPDHLKHQVLVRIFVAQVAFAKWLDIAYPTNN